MNGAQITRGPGVQRLHFQWRTRNLSSLLPEPSCKQQRTRHRGKFNKMCRRRFDVYVRGVNILRLRSLYIKNTGDGNLKSTKHWGLFWIISLVRLWHSSFPLVGEVTFSGVNACNLECKCILPLSYLFLWLNARQDVNTCEHSCRNSGKQPINGCSIMQYLQSSGINV